ncbi:MAG: flippase [Saccharofermentans sp.]|nr:flippase [Saccharofermentans sp.]
MDRGAPGRILSNSVWIIIQHLYSMITSMVLVALIARHLGPSDYGWINYCTSYITLFTTLSGLGLDNVIVSEIIRRPEKEDSYLGTAIVMRFAMSLLSYPMLLAVISAVNPGNRTLLAVASLQAIGMVFQTYDVLVYWFKIKLKMKYVSIAIIIAVSITSVIRIILLIRKATVEWFALSLSVQSFLIAVIIATVFVKKKDTGLKISIADARSLLHLSYNCIISSISIIIYMEADKIILEKMTDSAHVGIYSAAVMLATYWQFVPMALIDSTRPVVLEKKKVSDKEYLDQFKLVLAGTNTLSFVFAMIMSCFSWIFISFVYGNDYIEAVIPLVILSWASFIGTSGSARSIWIAGESYYSYDKWFTVTAAVLNVGLDVLLIWKFGIVGAAAATLITYVYEVLIVPLFFRKTRVFTKLYFQSFLMIPRFMSESVKMLRGRFGRKQ